MIIHHRDGIRQQAQGLTEYALILVLVAVVTIVALTLVGGEIQYVFCTVTAGLGSGDGCYSTSGNVEACVPQLNANSLSFEVELGGADGTSDGYNVSYWVDDVKISHTEQYYAYCFHSGTTSCTGYPLSSGRHVVEARVYSDGSPGTQTGGCKVMVNVP